MATDRLGRSHTPGPLTSRRWHALSGTVAAFNPAAIDRMGLGETGDKTPVAGLCRLLAHRVELVRARATAAIGKIADPETATALRIASGDMTGTRVRQAGHPDAEHPVPEAFLA
jgi:hypothetical protein